MRVTDDMKIIYKFNDGRGAVLCRNCRVIIDANISYDEAVKRWAGKDLCDECSAILSDICAYRSRR